uniref:Uncharacterized protein n=1 Tax=Rangifer tarandus platyrhynchus TaxID=3082113 RepID=A0ACB0FE93_RANTA|nr:unnamed protein product [Rangifer tarandus platyrhynchus]
MKEKRPSFEKKGAPLAAGACQNIIVRSRTLASQGALPRRLTPRIGRARKALWTPHLQIPLPELGDSPARPSLLGRLTRRRRKPAVGNTVLWPGHAKLLWAVDPGQTRVQARRSRQSRGTRRALALQAHEPPRRQSSKAGARLSCCQSAPVRVYPSNWFLSNSSRGSFLRGFFPLAV